MTEYPTYRVYRTDQANRLGTTLRRKQIAHQRHADGNHRTRAKRLNDAPNDHCIQSEQIRIGTFMQDHTRQQVEYGCWQFMSRSHPPRASDKNGKAYKVNLAPPDQVGDPPGKG